MKPAVASVATEALPSTAEFQTFFAAGFECSTFRRRSGQRMDFISETRHDKFARLDYERLRESGIGVAREGVRWHLVETLPGHYDFSSAQSIVTAARLMRTQVVWDLCHFGWPDHLDLFKPQFVSALANYGAAFARWLSEQTDQPGFFVPVNEISFFSWASGDEGSMDPFITGRGFELKAQLVRAAIATMDAIWSVMPHARFIHTDPLIHVVASPKHPDEKADAEAYRESQFQAWDMLSGRLWPELGGQERYLDILGANYYPQNQWFYDLKGIRRVRKFQPLKRTDPLYRPFREMLTELYQRYRRPLLITETGAEHRARPGWLRYVCQEAEATLLEGLPLHGICWYPILNHPGWVDDRHCRNGLWDYPNERGERRLYAPLAAELGHWQKRIEMSRHALTG